MESLFNDPNFLTQIVLKFAGLGMFMAYFFTTSVDTNNIPATIGKVLIGAGLMGAGYAIAVIAIMMGELVSLLTIILLFTYVIKRKTEDANV